MLHVLPSSAEVTTIQAQNTINKITCYICNATAIALQIRLNSCPTWKVNNQLQANILLVSELFLDYTISIYNLSKQTSCMHSLPGMQIYMSVNIKLIELVKENTCSECC